MLNALFVTDCRILVRRAGPGFRRIFTTIPVYVIEVLGLGVIRFQLVVTDRPGRRDAAMMTNLAEVFFAQTKERRAVELCITADEIIRVRVQCLPVAIAPRLFGVVFTFEIDGASAPVILLARYVIAAFEEEDLLAGGRELVGQRAAARARTDNDHVVVIVACHDD